MVKRGGNIVLNSYDDLFETQQSKEDAGKEKVDMDKVTIKPDVLKKYFPKSYTPKQMEDTIIKLKWCCCVDNNVNKDIVYFLA